VSGEPLYFETTDYFADLRQRFFEVVQRCRQVMKWPEERVLSWGVVGKGQAPRHHIGWARGFHNILMSFARLRCFSGQAKPPFLSRRIFPHNSAHFFFVLVREND